MKISKKLERALSYAVGQRKIKGWENFTGCIEVQHNNGDRVNCRSKEEIEKLVDSLKGVDYEHIC